MDIALITHLLNGLLMVAIPVALGIYLARRFRLGWRLWWIGAITFILSQVGHIPFNSLLTQMFRVGLLPAPPAAWKLPFNAVVLGLSAGIWEEGLRYIVYRWWAKDARSWKKGVFFGAGHGGMEAILLGILVLYTFIQMVALRNADLSIIIPPEQLTAAQQQVSTYWASPWYANLLGAVERFLSIPVQITLAVVVLQAFTRHQARWLWLAIGWHALIDASTVFAAGIFGNYWTEVIIAVFSLLSVWILFQLYRPEPPETVEDQLPLPPHKSAEDVKPLEETSDNIEKTRYN